MRKLLLLLFLSFSLAGLTQTDTGSSLHKGRRPTLINNDSLAGKLEQFQDSVAKQVQIRQDQESMDRNLNALLQVQKQRENKQRKEAIMRICIGVGFLIIMVIGLMRRRKKKN
jgi:hypothetical protein